MENRVMYGLVAGVACLFLVLMKGTPRIPQPQGFHDFADKTPILRSQAERWGWTSFYVGMTFAAFGSSYYHLKPNEDRLLWDRLPMTVGAASILAIFIIERIDEKKGTMLIIPLNMVISRPSSLWSVRICAICCHCSCWYFGASKVHTFNILPLGNRAGEATDRVTF